MKFSDLTLWKWGLRREKKGNLMVSGRTGRKRILMGTGILSFLFGRLEGLE